MNRPRSPRYRDLPDNLTYDSACGKYRYRNPITRQQTYLSADKPACIKAARKLNARLMSASDDLIERVTGGGNTWTMAVYRFERERAPDYDWSHKTRSQYASYLRNLRACALGTMAVNDIEVVHIVAALDKLTDGKRMRNVYRHLMIQVFSYTINLGWRGDNPAELTLKAREKRQRMRLTQDGYDAIYEHAEPWLRVAMDMTLITLQRPEDLVCARYADITDNQLHIRQRKTGTKLKIGVGAELKVVIAASRDRKLCPFIVHRKATRTRASKQKSHPMQVTVDYLGKAFAEARAASGYYKNSKNPPPPFYEIKSLGGDRYRAMGWDESQIQALYGHADKETTDGYLAGHEPPWSEVTSG